MDRRVELGDYGSPPAAGRQVLGWPDERSLCVVQRGVAWVVRADDPTQAFEVDFFPICDVLVVPEHGLVVFADFTGLVAYGADGLAWTTRRLAWDEVAIVGVEDDRLRVTGYDPTNRAAGFPEFSVDLRTGVSADAPYPP